MSEFVASTIQVSVTLANEAEDWHLNSQELTDPTNPIWLSVCRAAGWDEVAPSEIILMAMAVIAGRTHPNPRGAA
jgi:hypothetical protein